MWSHYCKCSFLKWRAWLKTKPIWPSQIRAKAGTRTQGFCWPLWRNLCYPKDCLAHSLHPISSFSPSLPVPHMSPFASHTPFQVPVLRWTCSSHSLVNLNSQGIIVKRLEFKAVPFWDLLFLLWLLTISLCLQWLTSLYFLSILPHLGLWTFPSFNSLNYQSSNCVQDLMFNFLPFLSWMMEIYTNKDAHMYSLRIIFNSVRSDSYLV